MAVHAAVEELCAHLKQTGTGESKLATLRELGTADKPFDPNVFLTKAAKLIPPGTMAKINEYISREAVAPESVANPEPVAPAVVAEAATEVVTEEPTAAEDEVEEPTDQLTAEEDKGEEPKPHGRKRR